MDFKKFCDKHGSLLYRILSIAHENMNNMKRLDTIVGGGRWENETMQETFFKACLNDKDELRKHGFEVIIGDSATEKNWLYHAESNLILRYGKMTKKGMMAKCTSDEDKDFAENKESSLIPHADRRPRHAHLGYILDPDGISLYDMVIALPHDAKSNIDEWRYSETEQIMMDLSPRNDSKKKAIGNGFKKKLLAEVANKKENSTAINN